MQVENIIILIEKVLKEENSISKENKELLEDAVEQLKHCSNIKELKTILKDLLYMFKYLFEDWPLS